MITLRSRIFIIVSLIIFFVLGVSIFLFVSQKKTTTTTETTSSPVVTGQPSTPVASGGANNIQPLPANNTPAIRPVNQEEIEKNAVRQLAKLFIERYGTYSNDNGSVNIEEVQTLVTTELWSRLQPRMKSGTNHSPAGVAFVGMTTKVVSVANKEWSQSSATVFLQTIRSEEKNDSAIDRNQNVEVSLVKQGGQWLVADFKWL